MLKQAMTTTAAVALAVAVGACGSSNAPGVELAPSGGSTQAAVPTTPKIPAQISTKPVVTPPKDCNGSQLVKKDLVPGTGAVAQQGQTITVNYVGVLCKTGTEFDSSWKNHQPTSLQLTSGPTGVIAGWVQGIPGMHVGGRRELVIPASLAYGKTGRPPTIPPNSPLVFVVDLISVG